MTAAVTVLVPAYKAAAFIGETLAALTSQTFDSFTVVVSIDSTTDDTDQVCRALVGHDARFRIIVQPVRLGWVAHVNAMLGEVDTEYFCILPHDDLPTVTYLSDLHAALHARPDAVAAFCDMVEFGLWSTTYFNLSADHPDLADRVKPFFETDVRGVPFRALTRSTVLERGQKLEDVGYNGYAADVCWSLRLFCLGPCLRVAKPNYRKWIWPGSVVRGWDAFGAETRTAALVAHTVKCIDILKEFVDQRQLDSLTYTVVVRLLRAYRSGIDAYGRVDQSRHGDLVLISMLVKFLSGVDHGAASQIADLRHSDRLMNLGSPLAFHDGLWAVRIGNWDQAIGYFSEAIALRPDDAEAYRQLAVALRHKDRVADALVAIDQGLTLSPDDPDMLATGIDVCFGAADYRRAERLARHAVALHPQSQLLVTALDAVLASSRRSTDTETKTDAQARAAEVDQIRASAEAEIEARDLRMAEAVRYSQSLEVSRDRAEAYAETLLAEIERISMSAEIEIKARDVRMAEAVRYSQSLEISRDSAEAYAQTLLAEIERIGMSAEIEIKARDVRFAELETYTATLLSELERR